MAKGATEQVIRSSGNVFADLGLPDAPELNAKARLCAAINRVVERQGLTQAEAATALGINQPKISALLHYKLEGFSLERLLHFLIALGQDVEIRVKTRVNFKPEGNTLNGRLVRFMDEEGQEMDIQVKATQDSRSAQITVKGA